MSKQRPDDWMPFYVADYLRDTTMLTTEQHGAYTLLLMTYWTGQGPLPDDDRQLSAITKTELRRWKKVIRPALSKFFIIADKKWTQKRAQFEIDRAVDISKVRSIAGKVGGQASAATRAKPEAKIAAQQNANGSQNWQQTPKQNPTPSTLVHLNPEAAALYAPRARLLALCEMLGVSPATDASLITKFTTELITLQTEAGFDYERHILPAAKEARERGTKVKSLNYLRARAEELRAAEQPPSEPFEDTDEHGWRQRVRASVKIALENNVPLEQAWPKRWGPILPEAAKLYAERKPPQ